MKFNSIFALLLSLLISAMVIYTTANNLHAANNNSNEHLVAKNKQQDQKNNCDSHPFSANTQENDLKIKDNISLIIEEIHDVSNENKVPKYQKEPNETSKIADNNLLNLKNISKTSDENKESIKYTKAQDALFFQTLDLIEKENKNFMFSDRISYDRYSNGIQEFNFRDTDPFVLIDKYVNFIENNIDCKTDQIKQPNLLQELDEYIIIMTDFYPNDYYPLRKLVSIRTQLNSIQKVCNCFEKMENVELSIATKLNYCRQNLQTNSFVKENHTSANPEKLNTISKNMFD